MHGKAHSTSALAGHDETHMAEQRLDAPTSGSEHGHAEIVHTSWVVGKMFFHAGKRDSAPCRYDMQHC